MKIGKLLTAIMLPVLMFLWTLPVAAQINRGVLQGIVTDPQGGVVPGVDVTVTSVDTNIATLTKTNATGYYRVGNLIPGKYRARFELAGFSMLEMTDVEIIAGTETRLDAQLKVSATRQTIQVAAQVPLVETAASNSTETLGSQLATDIPLAGRDLLQLAFLIPGTNTASGPPGSNFGFNSAYGFGRPKFICRLMLVVYLDPHQGFMSWFQIPCRLAGSVPGRELEISSISHTGRTASRGGGRSWSRKPSGARRLVAAQIRWRPDQAIHDGIAADARPRGPGGSQRKTCRQHRPSTSWPSFPGRRLRHWR